ncbi:MAG: cytochrome b N-terminal domain-containing protein [Dehalococcoidia bacterium]|nr:cytochrome b N-terminal domain-containing protein [Dehalococcoidia bacterium]
MIDKVGRWLDERTGASQVWQAIFKRKIPLGVNFLYTFGAVTMFLFTLQALTGIFLAMNYSPSPEHAYDSVLYITNEVAFGSIVRGLHHWGSSAMVVVVVLHMAVVFYLGAYRYPREVTWLTGVVLLLLVLGFSFTGYLLPWDEKAYWATAVGTNMAGTVPFVGGFLLALLRGGTEIGAVSLARFYAFHTFLLPALAISLMGVHLFLVVKHGVSVPPWIWRKATTGQKKTGRR